VRAPDVVVDYFAMDLCGCGSPITIDKVTACTCERACHCDSPVSQHDVDYALADVPAEATADFITTFDVTAAASAA